MEDRAPTKPGRVLITPENGSPAYYATVAMADEPTQAGTALNKQNLLSDPVATLIGLTAAAVPDDMFDVLAHAGDLHVWRRTKSGVIDYPVSVNPNAYQTGTVAGTTIEYLGQLGDKARMRIVSYVGTNTYGSSNKTKIIFDFVPQMVFIGTSYEGESVGIIAYKSTSGVVLGSTLGSSPSGKMDLIDVEWDEDEKSVSWYSSIGAYEQMNSSRITYFVKAMM